MSDRGRYRRSGPVSHGRYGLTPGEMLESLTMMIDSDDFVVEGREAIESVRSGLGNPAQQTYFLIAQLGRKAGCARTVTFDQRAAKAGPDMELLT